MLAVITLAGLISFLFWYVAVPIGLGYLGGVLLAPDEPEAEEEVEGAQSRKWNPHTTQQEGIARPRAYGKNMHHGNIIANWTSVESNREVLYLLLDHGDGPTKGIVTPITDNVFLNNQPAGNFTSFDIQERFGTMNQDCMTDFDKPKLDYPQNTKLEKNVPVIVTTPNDFFDDLEYTILWPGGLYRHGRDGKRKEGFCRIRVRIREVGSGEEGWVQIHNTYYHLVHPEPLFLFRVVSNLWDNIDRGTQYDLEFTNLTGPLDRHINEVYLRSFREVSHTAFTHPGRALVGIRAVATIKLSGKLDVKVIREDRIIRNVLTNVLEYNNNRASVVWDMATLPVIDGDGTPEKPYEIIRYEGIAPKYLDLEFFSNWAQFCKYEILDGYGVATKEPRCACNTIVDEFTNILDLARKIASVGRATLYWAGHQLTGWIDDIVTTRKDLVTMDSMMHKTWKNAWSVEKELAGVVEVFYKDERQGFERTSADWSVSEAGRFNNPISLEGVGIITRGAAVHYANYLLERNRLIRNANKFRVHKDGFRYKLGNVIRLQCRISNWGHAFTVRSYVGHTITVDRDASTEISVGDTLFIRTYDTFEEIVVTDIYEVTDVSVKVITVERDWDVTPIKGNLVAVGAAGDIKLRRIIKLKPTTDNYFDVEVETYDRDLYYADDINPNNPNANYTWLTPVVPLITPITKAEVENLISQAIPPPLDIDIPWPSNITWKNNWDVNIPGERAKYISWTKTDGDDDMSFRLKGVSHDITSDSTDKEFVYWNPLSPTTFSATPDFPTAELLAGSWLMCRNKDGTAYPATPIQLLHAGVLQAGTITAAYGQIANAAITTAKIKNLAVETLKIKDEAVTLMVAAYTAGQLSYTDSTAWHQAQTITMDLTGAKVMILAALQWSGLGAGGINIRIQRDNSVTVYSANMNDVGQFGNPFCVAIVDEDPGIGEHVYDLDIATTHNETPKEWLKFKSRSLVGQEVKK